MRWKTRSAPDRSTCTLTAGYLASKAFASASETFTSVEVYQTTLPSFAAAAASCGVASYGAGACAAAGPGAQAAAAAVAIAAMADFVDMSCLLLLLFTANALWILRGTPRGVNR